MAESTTTKSSSLSYWIIGAVILLVVVYFFFFKGKTAGGENAELSFLDAAGKKEYWDTVKWLKAQPDDVQGSWKQRIVATAKEKGIPVNQEIHLAVIWCLKNNRGLI